MRAVVMETRKEIDFISNFSIFFLKYIVELLKIDFQKYHRIYEDP